MGWGRWVRGLGLAGVAWTFRLAAPAQDAGLVTLHVFTNVVQIPVLVLTESLYRVSPKKQPRFLVSLDLAPPAPAAYVRAEGDDPIALSIVLDVSGNQDELLPPLTEAIKRMGVEQLREHDRVAVYAMDCQLVRSGVDAAPTAETLGREVNEVLHSPVVHVGAAGTGCASTRHLWDSLMFVTHDMAKTQGRRVMLVVSDGHDGGSTRLWTDVKSYANSSGVAVFGMQYKALDFARVSSPYSRHDDEFHSVCELSGGIVLTSDERGAAAAVKRFVGLVRDRFIVEFQRPKTLNSGYHNVAVTVAKGTYFVKAAGISVSIANPEEVDPVGANGGAAEGASTSTSDPASPPSSPTPAPASPTPPH